jgi:hypothetical protein
LTCLIATGPRFAELRDPRAAGPALAPARSPSFPGDRGRTRRPASSAGCDRPRDHAPGQEGGRHVGRARQFPDRSRSSRADPPIDVNKDRLRVVRRKTCYGAAVEECIVVRGSGSRILLIGDSHALSLVPAFARFARAVVSRWRLVVSELPVAARARRGPHGSPTDLPQTCLAHQSDWYDRLVPRFDPDVIVLAHRPIDDARADPTCAASGELIHPGKKGFARAVRAAARDSVEASRWTGARSSSSSRCRSLRRVQPDQVLVGVASYLDDCRYYGVAEESHGEVLPLARQRHQRRSRSTLDRLVCPYFPICDPIVRGVVVKRDQQHITAATRRHGRSDRAGSSAPTASSQVVIRSPASSRDVHESGEVNARSRPRRRWRPTPP